eukprot:10861390-Ditylum_brightwellii.AAC.1
MAGVQVRHVGSQLQPLLRRAFAEACGGGHTAVSEPLRRRRRGHRPNLDACLLAVAATGGNAARDLTGGTCLDRV